MTQGTWLHNMEKAEVLNATFASVFTSKTRSQESQVPETRGIIWSKEDAHFIEKDQVREYLSELDICKSMVPEGIHPQVLRKLANVIVRKVNATLIFKNGKKETV